MEAKSATERAIAEEQGFVDSAYEALDGAHTYYTDQLTQVRRQGGRGTPGARSERDSFATHYEDNLLRLRNVENRLVLGRLDHTDGTTLHIGRITLRDGDEQVLLTDWRAPQSQAFYQATAAHPGDVVRRRHIQTRLREVTGVEDELLTVQADSSELNLTGEGALLAAMSSAREGKMGDIVATIQVEQDQIIRSDAAGILVVQGGPGTGKTAVALHRAAYLLYTQRERLSRSGVLIVGPSPVFLRYIDQVLPSLGESDVVSTTLEQLVPEVQVSATEPAEVAQIKGREVWEKIAKRAVRKILQKPLERAVQFRVDGKRLTLTPEMVEDAQRRARRGGKPHNQARETYARRLVNSLARQLADATETTIEDSPWLVTDVAESVDARREINLRWLPSSPTRLLERLYQFPELLAQVAGELRPAERARLRRERGAGFTQADVAIVDELAELLGPFATDTQRHEQAAKEREDRELGEYVEQTMKSMNLGGGIVSAAALKERVADLGSGATLAERAATDRSWTYGHVVVDEAQELSPMQWRMIARRNPSRSMTLVGDLDQRRAGAPDSGWSGALGKLAGNHRVEELTISYRTPASILELAQNVMRAAGYPVRPVNAARDLPDSFTVTRGGLPEAISLIEAANRDLDELYGKGRGTVGVIVPENLYQGTQEALSNSPRLSTWTGARFEDGQSGRIQVVTPTMAKGLEYDVVVLLEPKTILETGPGDLYVAMTRPTRRLHVVATGDLPDGF